MLMVTCKYLVKYNVRLKVPRPVHRTKDSERVEAFRAEFCEKLHASQISLQSSVPLWAMDEMRSGFCIVDFAGASSSTQIDAPLAERHGRKASAASGRRRRGCIGRNRFFPKYSPPLRCNQSANN